MSSPIVRREEDGWYMGPLSDKEYQTVNDALELASAWIVRDANSKVADTLKQLIPDPEDVEDCEKRNRALDLFNKLPDIEDC